MVELPLGFERVWAEVWILEPQPGLAIYFVDQPAFYDRASLYSSGKDYVDDAARFIFFSKAVLHLARYLPWQPK